MILLWTIKVVYSRMYKRIYDAGGTGSGGQNVIAFIRLLCNIFTGYHLTMSRCPPVVLIILRKN